MNKPTLRVLIVDDSPVVRQLLRYILEQGGMEVIGEAGDGEQALTMLAKLKPDVITMDIHMPVMDGYEASRRIMADSPIPIIVVTASYKADDAAVAMHVLDAGAVTVLQKPQGIEHPDFERDALALVRTVRAVSEVKLVRRIRRVQMRPEAPIPKPAFKPSVVAIGASTGGPVALKTLLERLSPDFPCPILVVQHIAPGFLTSFCEWLKESSALAVTIGEFSESVLPGKVYLAPDHCHMEITAEGKILLKQAAPGEVLCPSVARLFESVDRHYGKESIVILLSGMGRDGAIEMAKLRSNGALTLVQDPSTVVVNGMPGEATRLGAACHVLSPEQMAAFLNQYRCSSQQQHEID